MTRICNSDAEPAMSGYRPSDGVALVRERRYEEALLELEQAYQQETEFEIMYDLRHTRAGDEVAHARQANFATLGR